MSRPSAPPLIVMFHPQLPAEDATELLDCLHAFGTPRLRQQPELRGPSELVFLMLIYLPLAAFLTAIGTTIGNRLAKDAYDQLVGALRRLQAQRRAVVPPDACVAGLSDTDTGVLVVLEAGLPDLAYQQLPHLDLDQLRPGPVYFREDEWRATNRDTA